MGIFSRKPPATPNLTIDEAKTLLGCPVDEYIYNAKHLWRVKLESCTLPQDNDLWLRCTLNNDSTEVSCWVGITKVGIVRPQAMNACYDILRTYGGLKAPGVLHAADPWSVYVDMRNYRPER
jgi:hypothetical protein